MTFIAALFTRAAILILNLVTVWFQKSIVYIAKNVISLLYKTLKICRNSNDDCKPYAKSISLKCIYKSALYYASVTFDMDIYVIYGTDKAL